jgi:hypothetical protein
VFLVFFTLAEYTICLVLHCSALLCFASLRKFSWLSVRCRVKGGECIGEDGKGVKLNVKGDKEDAYVRAVPVRDMPCLSSCQ